jgi:hypothetical protein
MGLFLCCIFKYCELKTIIANTLRVNKRINLEKENSPFVNWVIAPYIYQKRRLMKNIFVLLLICGIVGLSSCGNGGNSPTPVIAGPDSTSKGGNLEITFVNDSGTTEHFNIIDYVKSNVAIYSLYASAIYSATDSLYHLKVQVVDYKMKQIGLYLELTNTTATGLYYVRTNSSTFTDYSRGQNLTYGISVGSTVNITQASYPIEGSFNLGMYHNHDVIPATGSFKIYY